ncbi:hypothetical protein [Chamaesiphon polymorphus]|uniref:Uncharacterized protein n=1 Tax=Chamaesiphon polymorphus CCALA 037 TaxID=2107692 RepID=A0A2T1G3P2_9CYAN|nr:hypothetical protein [Chamaesiphon polymorphus]PSB51869.1 hypothetical protein C7B77_21095 [Chamaesiphon polymorphus CCALA 037]
MRISTPPTSVGWVEQRETQHHQYRSNKRVERLVCLFALKELASPTLDFYVSLEGNGIIRTSQVPVNFVYECVELRTKVRENFLVQGIYEPNGEVYSSPTVTSIGIERVANAPFSVSEIAPLENHFIKVGSNNSTESPITISKACAKEAASHHSILQITPTEGWHITKFTPSPPTIDLDNSGGVVGFRFALPNLRFIQFPDRPTGVTVDEWT